MPIIKLILLILGILSIVTGVALVCIPLALVVGGSLLLAVLWLISVAEGRRVK